MMLPPLSMWLYVAAPDRKTIRLWLPLFLVWLLFLPVLLLVLAATMVADVVLFLAGQEYHRYTLLIFGVMEMVADTRGLTVRVNGDKTTVDVTVT